MSNSTVPLHNSLQSQVCVLGPGITGLFLQGLETGLVVAQFCRWFSSTERNDGAAFSALVVFVTVVGFAQSGIYFAYTWQRYVREFGKPIEGLNWVDYTQVIPNMAIAVPVQGWMIWRCYRIVEKNMYIITPLVLLLTTSIALSIWTIVQTLRFELTVGAKSYLHLPESVGISYPFLINLVAPSVLDVVLTGILLHRLTRTMKHVYTAHMRRKLSHFMTVVWQSAIPPTLCTIVLSIFYIQFAIARRKSLQVWYTVIQGMIGKLYVLSLFYITLDSGSTTSEQLPTFMATLTVPIECRDSRSLTSGIVSCHQMSETTAV